MLCVEIYDETMHMLRRGQVKRPGAGDTLGQAKSAERLFAVAA
jgi:hypothetical protein